MELEERAQKIRLLLMDCDGVLTDGRLYFSERGEALKVFNVKDGQGIALWHDAGGMSGIISGRDAQKLIELRCDELGIHFLRTGTTDKVREFEELMDRARVSAEETAYVGDDIGDLSLMERVGFAVAVGDAVDEVVRAAHYVTSRKGGQGAVREVIDLLLRSRSSG
jgi:3-deoxy-D-manno-octulosonate 8-phosphate phosphatase (KDO 8-P phosphatase)